MNILIVDDERMLLEEMDENVAEIMPAAKRFCFTKAKDALEFAERVRIDVALLDINMRVVDGVTMAKQIQGRYPKVNIIFCTGHTQYALEALELNCSGYILKPVTEEKLRGALEHLRYKVEDYDDVVIEFKCFGNFEALCNGQPIRFKYSKTKEMLAYLVDRNGASCTTGEIAATLFEDEDHRSYFNQIRLDLIKTFTALGAADVIRQSKGIMSVDRNKVKCDYFDYCDDKIQARFDEYMTQYSFGEGRLAAIEVANVPDYWK